MPTYSTYTVSTATTTTRYFFQPSFNSKCPYCENHVMMHMDYRSDTPCEDCGSNIVVATEGIYCQGFTFHVSRNRHHLCCRPCLCGHCGKLLINRRFMIEVTCRHCHHDLRIYELLLS